MQQRYNLALIPESTAVNSSLIELAERNLPQADRYLLGEQAMPHVTLCQFRADESQAQAFRLAIAEGPGEDLLLEPQLLSFAHIYIKPGQLQHTGKYWVGLAIREREHLTILHQFAASTLKRMTLEVLTTGDYFPHLTLGRIPPLEIAFGSLPAPEGDFFNTAHNFHCRLGLSDENGVLLSILN